TRDGELALAGYRLSLIFVFVDAPDDKRRSILSSERRHPFELLQPVFKIDRVDNRLALTVSERALDGDRIGRIDHYRRLHNPDHLLVEAVHIVKLVAIGILEIDVAYLGSAFDLLARYLRSFFVFLFGDQTFELARADLIRSFSYNQRPLLVAGFD